MVFLRWNGGVVNGGVVDGGVINGGVINGGVVDGGVVNGLKIDLINLCSVQHTAPRLALVILTSDIPPTDNNIVDEVPLFGSGMHPRDLYQFAILAEVDVAIASRFS